MRKGDAHLTESVLRMAEQQRQHTIERTAQQEFDFTQRLELIARPET